MTDPVTSISHVARLDPPAALRDLPGWLIWRFEPNPNGGKPRKVPYYTNGGRRHGQHGKPEDRNQLSTFDMARSAAARRRFDGVGFATLADFGIVALDFDDCFVDGQPQADLLPVLSATYAEYSPSGKGIRAFLRGSLGNHKSHQSSGFDYGLEVFSTTGFVTFTGNVLSLCRLAGNTDTVAPVDEDISSLVRARFKRDLATSEPSTTQANGEALGLTRAELDECLEVLPTDLPYDSWLQVGMALHHETHGEGFHIWDEWSRKSSKYTTMEYGLERWHSFGRHTGTIVTARSLVHLANEHGAHISLNRPATAADFEKVKTDGNSKPGSTGNRFDPIPVARFADRPPPEWIVKGVLPRAELVVLFGESGSGKSFMALDLAAAISLGREWRGRRVRAGRVVYIAAEGAGGFRNRLAAYARGHGISLVGLPLDVIPDAPNLLLKEDALAVAKAIGPADVVFIDTFAQVMPGGDENAAEDMGKALAHCKGIRRATGALVVLVHHSGKDASRGARGWSGLRAAADAELEVLRQPSGRILRISKQKDGDDDAQWGFALEKVEIGLDADGDPITSCVVVEQDVAVARVTRVLGPNEVTVDAVLQDFAKAQLAGIEVDAVVAEAVRRMPAPENGKRDLRKQYAKRALTSLLKDDNAPYFMEADNTITVG